MNKSSIKTSIQIIHNPISLIRLKETFKTKTENKPQGGALTYLADMCCKTGYGFQGFWSSGYKITLLRVTECLFGLKAFQRV